MLVQPDCEDAEPVRERARDKGYQLTGGFGAAGELWVRQSNPIDPQALLYCRPGDKTRFLTQSVIASGI